VPLEAKRIPMFAIPNLPIEAQVQVLNRMWLQRVKRLILLAKVYQITGIKWRLFIDDQELPPINSPQSFSQDIRQHCQQILLLVCLRRHYPKVYRSSKIKEMSLGHYKAGGKRPFPPQRIAVQRLSN